MVWYGIGTSGDDIGSDGFIPTTVTLPPGAGPNYSRVIVCKTKINAGGRLRFFWKCPNGDSSIVIPGSNVQINVWNLAASEEILMFSDSDQAVPEGVQDGLHFDNYALDFQTGTDLNIISLANAPGPNIVAITSTAGGDFMVSLWVGLTGDNITVQT